MIFVDTNYFVRYLLADIPAQYKEAKRLFEKASLGEERLFSNTVVFFELFWVFTKFYGKTKSEIVKILSAVLEMDFVDWAQWRILSDALEMFKESKIELEDCYHLVYAGEMEMEGLATFEKKLLKQARKMKGSKA